jgi:chloramphenicol-sensitive protein RarD
VWSALLVFAWLLFKHGRGWLRVTLAAPRIAWMLALSGVLIGFNWALYIWAVNAGHVVETALGYFINPLLNVVIGVLFLRERLRPVQWVSVAIAACGVLWLTLRYGSFPWIALLLAASFALYGLIRKLAAVAPIRGLGVESAYLVLPALALLLWGESNGQGGFFTEWGIAIDALLVFAGVLTALPLIGFAFAVQRVTLSVVGVMQYIAPTLQFLIGVLVFREAFDTDRAIGFAFIWIALALFAGEGLLRSRRQLRAEVATA